MLLNFSEFNSKGLILSLKEERKSFVLTRSVGHAASRGSAMTGTKCSKKRDARAKPPKAMFTLELYWIALVPKRKSIRHYSMNTNPICDSPL